VNNSLPLNGRTVVGAGARSTIIDAGAFSKVFYATGGTNSVSGLTMRNGNGDSEVGLGLPRGGAVFVEQGSLTLTNVTVSGSTAASADQGGGVAIQAGSMTIVGSTIVGNTVTSGGGPQGGGIYVAGGSMTIRNSTISGNSTFDIDGTEDQGGGVYVEAGTLTMDNVTIARNGSSGGGGIYVNGANSPTVTMQRTLIAGNSIGACAGVAPTGSLNMASDATCGFAGSPQNPLIGALANNGGQTDTHALAAGSPAINAGGTCSTTTDQRGVARQGACDIGAYEFSTGTVQPQPLPKPVAGQNFNAFPDSGMVKVKPRGKKAFHVLKAGEHIPVGSTIDTRKGRIQIIVAANKSGKTWTADFYDGLFKLTQTKGNKPTTVLTLTEKLTGCKATGKASDAAKKKKKRRLWGDGKGRFQTKGKRSAATVVGTKWLVEDRCTSTLTRVARGKVRVRDFVKKKTVLVKKGHQYIARARP
jgi:hypothetical protein